MSSFYFFSFRCQSAVWYAIGADQPQRLDRCQHSDRGCGGRRCRLTAPAGAHGATRIPSTRRTLRGLLFCSRMGPCFHPNLSFLLLPKKITRPEIALHCQPNDMSAKTIFAIYCPGPKSYLILFFLGHLV